jgi:histidine decarboxylase
MASGIKFDSTVISDKARSPHSNYCCGYSDVDTGGHYITACKVSCGKERLDRFKDDVLTGIVAFGRSQKGDAYLGQTNMIKVSSFTGPLSAVWGLDLAVHNGLRDKLLFEHKSPMLSNPIPVYDMAPLLEAAESLFGRVDTRDKHFPPLPGSHWPCAYKSFTAYGNRDGPGYVWCFLLLAVAKNRSADSSLFMEDSGFFPSAVEDDELIRKYLDKKQESVAESGIACGQDLLIDYQEIFIGYNFLYVTAEECGTAISYGPYFLLAGGAYPKGGPSQLATMTLSQWKEEVLEKN